MSKKNFLDLSQEERREWGIRVKGLRQAQGMKQEDLAELASVTRQTISNMESGSVVPQAEKLRRVLEVLGVETGGGEFEEQTEQWLTIMGTLIEATPVSRRDGSVNAAIRVLSDGVRATPSDAELDDVLRRAEDARTEKKRPDFGLAAEERGDRTPGEMEDDDVTDRDGESV